MYSDIQQEAFKYAQGIAKQQTSQFQKDLESFLNAQNISVSYFEEWLNKVSQQLSVVIHFHPDRFDTHGRTVLESLLATGAYQNQFQSGISNGGLTAFKGGQRDIWEQDLFGGFYQQELATISDRPKYGALDLFGFADGAAPRFGSCYFRLSSQATQRCTFSSKDSYFNPEEIGTADYLLPIVWTWAQEYQNDQTVKEQALESFSELLHTIQNLSMSSFKELAGRKLDEYVEAQIHSSISLQEDIISLVVDGSFQHTEIEPQLEQLCGQFDIELQWNTGFKLPAQEVSSALRGEKMPLLAHRISNGGALTAYVIGKAAQSVVEHPARWQDWDTPANTLQDLKHLWHTLVYQGYF